MSVRLMSAIWQHGPPSASERLVLLALADNANDDGICWPSMETLANKACMTDRGVRKIMRRLEDAGWVTVTDRGRQHSSNVYQIHDPRPEHGSALGGSRPERGSPLKKSRPERGSASDRNVVPPDRNTVPPNHQEPPIEPSSLPSGEARTRDPGDLLDQSLEAECNDADDDAAAGASDHDAEAPAPTDQGGADGGGGRSAGGGRKGSGSNGTAHRKPAAKPAKQRRQFPEDWWPSEKGIAYAEQRGCPDIAENVAACVDYHRSHGNTWLDLEATWRTWCRNAGKYGWATASGGNAHAQAAANGGVRGGYSNAGDRARQATDRMSAAAARIAARWDERDRARAAGTGSSAVPIVDLAAYRDSGTG